MARSPKPAMPEQLVVWGAKSLTMTEKAVWYHTWFLDQGGEDGCYIGQRSMAARLGIAERTVEDVRARLGRLKMLESWTRTEGRERGYRAVLPAGIHKPRTFREATAELAASLDAHVAETDAGPRPTPYREPRQARSQTHGTPVPSAGGAPREGGRGEGASFASVSSRQLPPAVEYAEDAGEGNGLMRPGRTGSSERLGDLIQRLDIPGAA